MKRRDEQALGAPRSRRGTTLIELLMSASILVVVLLSVFALVQRDSKLSEATISIADAETKAQQMLRRLETELAHARGARPTATLTADLSGAETGQVFVDSTAGFPDRGLLLLDRSNGSVERIAYADLGGATTFANLSRGQQCTQANQHVQDSELLWAALAEPILSQVNPPASLWDGRALEPTGTVFFRGDGTGFSYRVPVDPTGAFPPNYFANGAVQWGAEVQGVGTTTGWAALVFEPRFTLTEAEISDDINHDGDEVDVFDVGQIRRRVWDSADPAVPASDFSLGSTHVLQERCNWGGDLDGDGFDDPIFLWDSGARRLHVRLYVVGRSSQHAAIVRRVDSMVFLRNEPEN